MERVTPTSPLVNESHCLHLRHKGMYVTSAPDPDESKLHGRYDATVYWCTCTQKSIGPDGYPVHADTCTAGRGCCEH